MSKQLTHDEKYTMIMAMRKYGGTFVQCLASCFSAADPMNFHKLLIAFPEYVDKYVKMAKEDNMSMFKPGDYVLATRWGDADPQDPWCVGIVASVLHSSDGIRYILGGSNREWRHCRAITKEQGLNWLKLYGEKRRDDTE